MRYSPPHTNVPLPLPKKIVAKLATHHPVPRRLVRSMVVVESLSICPLPNTEETAISSIYKLEKHF